MKLLVALLLLLAAPVAGPAVAADRTAPVVVELFTSQGCNTCPPADAYLGELAKRPEVLALSLHVDYWDYIGWNDPFAQAQFTKRQRGYAMSLAQRYVYTPQMVVDGRLQGVGSERGAIDRLIVRAQRENASPPAPRPRLQLADGVVSIGAGQPVAATVWLVVFDADHRTAVKRGENAGRNLANFNVVREWRALGRYRGENAALPLALDPPPSREQGYAVLVQQDLADGPGPILAAYVVDPPAVR